jgi:hypothetical protein
LHLTITNPGGTVAATGAFNQTVEIICFELNKSIGPTRQWPEDRKPIWQASKAQ